MKYQKQNMKFNNKFKIGKKYVGAKQQCYFIADIGANHDGDINRAKKLIKLCADNGVDGVKFQHFQAQTIVSDYGFKNLGKKSSHQSKWKKSVFETYKKASLNLEWNKTLIDECKKYNIDFLTSPYSYDLVKNISKIVSAIKVGSGDITWIELIKFIAKQKKPIIIATGASKLTDVKRAVMAAKRFNNKIVLMQCNTNYSGEEKNFKFLNLNVLHTYKKKFQNIILGLSDHTQGYSSVLGAVALGAKVIEKHFTDNRGRSGPDHKFAIEPSEWSEMVKETRRLESSLGNDIKKIEFNEKETVVLQRRSIRAKNIIRKGHVIKKNDLVFLRPSPNGAMDPFEYKKIINKVAIKDIPKEECLIIKKNIK